MSSVLTEAVHIKKLFKWTINKFDELDASNLKQVAEERCGLRNYIYTIYLLESPEMTAIDPYDGTKYTATFSLKFIEPPGPFYVLASVSPFRDNQSCSCYCLINDDPTQISCGDKIFVPWNKDIKTVTVYAGIRGVKSIHVPPFKKLNPSNLGDRLKEMWKSDSSNKFTIKCDDETSIEAYKPILAARSFFFKDMFATENMTGNSLEITDFEVGVVQKMIEFCETDDIKDSEGLADELFKIAHKLQIPDLMDFAVEKMSENANGSNIQGYLQLAIDYKLKDFEEWCKNFAFRK